MLDACISITIFFFCLLIFLGPSAAIATCSASAPKNHYSLTHVSPHVDPKIEEVFELCTSRIMGGADEGISAAYVLFVEMPQRRKKELTTKWLQLNSESVRLSACLSVCQPVCLSICLSVQLQHSSTL